MIEQRLHLITLNDIVLCSKGLDLVVNNNDVVFSFDNQKKKKKVA